MPTRPAGGGAVEDEQDSPTDVMKVEELSGLLKRARQGPMPADRYELLKAKVKALLANQAASSVKEVGVRTPTCGVLPPPPLSLTGSQSASS